MKFRTATRERTMLKQKYFTEGQTYVWERGKNTLNSAAIKKHTIVGQNILNVIR